MRIENAMGVRSMMSTFLALHDLAAQRGEGLRPELLRLLERSRSRVEGDQANASSEETKNYSTPEFAAPIPPR
jgi:hypothetical protein